MLTADALLTPTQYGLAVAATVGCLVLYLLYKVAWPRDFGVPVRRQLLCRALRVERDQIAFAPLWWSDVQIQRAVKAHWKRTLQSALPPPPPPPSHRAAG